MYERINVHYTFIADNGHLFNVADPVKNDNDADMHNQRKLQDT